MKKEVLARRFLHCLIALAPLYYALPVDLPYIDVRRWVLLVAFFSVVSLIEAVRLWRGVTFFGLRPHEKDQIASFAWAAAGITLTLWLFPHEVATAVLVSMAFVDPLAGELRRTTSAALAVPIPMTAYFVISMLVLLATTDINYLLVGALSSVGAAVGIASESLETKYVDDDFLMTVLPALAMTALWLAV